MDARVEAKMVCAERDHRWLDDANDFLCRWIKLGVDGLVRVGHIDLFAGSDGTCVGDVGVGWERDGPELSPGGAVVCGALDPCGPLPVFDGRAANDGAVGEDEWLVFDGAKDAFGEAFRSTPGEAFVGADFAGTTPCAGVCAVFVVEPEAAIFGVEEDWVPAGCLIGTGQFYRSRPGSGVPARAVNGDIRCALFGAGKPRGEDVAILQLDESGGVVVGLGGGESVAGRDGLEDEAIGLGVGRHHDSEQAKGQKKKFHLHQDTLCGRLPDRWLSA